MAITDAYATAAEYRTSIQKTDTGADADVLLDLTAVSRYLERRLGRFFNVDAGDVTRIYTTPLGNPPQPGWAESENPWKAGGLLRVLDIDDLVSLTSVTIDEDRDGSFTDETALTANDYELLPRNAALGPEPRPYTAIELTSWGAKYAWPAATRVRVIGKFGWPSVPGPIKRACIQLTAILRLESPRATRRVSELGESVSTSRQANEIVDDLIRHYRRVVIG